MGVCEDKYVKWPGKTRLYFQPYAKTDICTYKALINLKQLSVVFLARPTSVFMYIPPVTLLSLAQVFYATNV